MLKNIYCASRQQSHRCQGNERLNHHEQFGPGGQDRAVRWRKCGTGVESKKKVIHKTWTPALLSHLALGLLVEGHLWKKECSVRMDAAQLTFARATCIQPPVP